MASPVFLINVTRWIWRYKSFPILSEANLTVFVFAKSNSSLFVMPAFLREPNAIDVGQRSGPAQSGDPANTRVEYSRATVATIGFMTPNVEVRGWPQRTAAKVRKIASRDTQPKPLTASPA